VGFQQVIIEEMRTGISIVQTQDNAIMQEASSFFQGIHQYIADMITKQVENGSKLLNHKKANVKIQGENKILSRRQNEMEEVIEGIQNFLDTLPIKANLLKHTKAMDETFSNIQEVCNGSTTHMEHYTISETTSHQPRSVQAEPSYTYGSRQARINEDSESFVTTPDTQDEAAERYGVPRGGNGDNDNGDDDDENSDEPEPGQALPGPGPPGSDHPGPNPPPRTRC